MYDIIFCVLPESWVSNLYAAPAIL
ncbi:uncharacterized protein METZ01_LOCUS347267, partial [marine metagenome]